MPYHINHICVLCDFFIDDLNKTCGVSNTCRKLKMRIFMCEKRTEVALALPTTPVNERQCALKEGPPAKQSAPVKQSDVSSCTVILPHHRPISIFFACITGSCLFKQRLQLLAHLILQHEKQTKPMKPMY